MYLIMFSNMVFDFEFTRFKRKVIMHATER